MAAPDRLIVFLRDPPVVMTCPQSSTIFTLELFDLLEWERPAWRVRWVDGPTRPVLMDRAAALCRYGVGAPLTVQDMRFARSSSGLARALAWLALADEAGQADTVNRVEQLLEDTGYPQDRAGEGGLATAELLNHLAGGDSVDMGRLLETWVVCWPPPLARYRRDR